MYKMKSLLHYIALLLIIASCEAQSLDLRNIDLYQHLPKFENQRYPLEEYELAWKDARSYIKREFEAYGLITQTQNFQTEIINFSNTVSQVDGLNIIGESQTPTINAPVFLVGAYYDSSLTHFPLKENGVSLAVLLETARNFQLMRQNGDFNQNTTILFVAFDLNVNNYIPVGNGKPGSSFFVKGWLSDYMRGRKFQGALILDSISTFSTLPNSQSIPEGFAESFPENSDRIKNSGYKADFLAVFSRPDESNQYEVQNLLTKFHEVNSDGLYHLEDLTLPDGAKIPENIVKRVQGNAVHDFWTNSPPLPAMFITDLEKTRTDFDHLSCNDNCSLQEFWSNERASFVGRTTEAVLRLLLVNQQGGDHTVPVIPGNSSPSLTVVDFFLAFWFILFYLIR